MLVSFYPLLQQRWSRLHRDAVLFGDQQITYGDLTQRVARAIGWIRQQGLQPGDVLGLQLERSLAYLEIHLACLATGVATLPLNTAYQPSETWFMLNDAGARLACVEDVRAAPPDCTAIPAATLRAELDTAPAKHPSDVPDEATALICYTSGTTGRPKGARISHRNLSAYVSALHRAWHWTPNDVLVHALPLFHIHGLCVAQLGALFAGAKSIWLAGFRADDVWHALDFHEATLYMGVPTHYRRLLESGVQPALASMRLFTSGSAPLPASIHTAFERRFRHAILERYGMTEIGIVLSNPYDGARIPETVGIPLPGVTALVVQPGTMEQRGTGQTGEVLIRGDSVFDGYIGLPEATSAVLVNGWMRTGDLGFVDAAGYFHLVGRRSDLILSGGLNVYPREVERVLLEHPSVTDVAVFGVTDADLGERVAAAVVLQHAITKAELSAFVRRELAGFKCPRLWDFVKVLPRNTMGKVTKSTLRDKWNRLEPRDGSDAELPRNNQS